MKLVILSDGFPPNSLGGAEVIALNQAEAFLKKGHDVTVVTTVRKETEAGKTFFEGVKVYKIYSNYEDRWRAYKSLYNRQVLSELKKILLDIKPDVVHAHNIHTHLSYASLRLSRKYTKALFLTAHDVMSFHYGKLGSSLKEGEVINDSANPLRQLSQYKLRYNPFRNLIIKQYFRNIDLIFAVSFTLKNALEKKRIQKVELLHNGIDITKWNIDPEKLEDFRRKYNLFNKKVLLFGGRLSVAKGIDITLQVLKEVSEIVGDIVLLIAGDKSKIDEKLLLEFKKLGLSEKIIFTGWLQHNEMKYAYSASDIVLVLSKYMDPFPTVNLEAMACKRPVVGTILGGTKEAVSDNITGYLVDPRNSVSITEKILDLLTNTEKAKGFGLAGFEKVSNYFSEEKWIMETLKYYDMILKLK